MRSNNLKTTFAAIIGALTLATFTAPVSAATVFDFPFNEGSGLTVTDTANNLKGYFGGIEIDPSIDTATLSSMSPSGAPGDKSLQLQRKAFVVAVDTNSVLNLTDGPITVESWVNIDWYAPQKNAEGIVSYGSSYKMGLKNAQQVFTLFGKVDITNNAAGFINAGEWVHLAAAWQPGVGVTFYVNGVANFVANTNTTTRAASNKYLTIGSEGPSGTNNLAGLYDRVRIHNAVLTAGEIDSNPTVPKPLYASTIVAYNFNEANLPASNAKAPAMPTMYGPIAYNDFFGPTWTNDTPTKLSGDYALNYNGTAKPITVADPGNVIATNSVNGDYTIEAWVKLPVGFTPTNRMVMMAYPGTHLGFSFSINNNRTLHTTFYKKKDVTSTAVVPNDGNWHHVAAVHQDGKEVRFYVDTQLAATTAYTTGPGFNVGPSVLTIGQESATTIFTGTIDRIRFSNQALTPDQFLFVNAPSIPTIFTNKTILPNQFASVDFSIANVSTFSGGASGVSLSATTTNTTLFPPGSITFSGSGSNRTVRLAPAAGKTGSALVTINATDGAIAVSGNTFMVKVPETNIVALWDFNSDVRDANTATGTFKSVVGSGIAAPVNVGESTFGGGMTRVADPETADNSQWRLGTFPAIKTGNKTAGAEFRFSTVGFQNIQFTWEHWNSASGSRYWRVQYALDGNNFQDYAVYSPPDCTNTYLGSVSFNGIPGANNNPNFAVRFVAEFVGTATGQDIPDDNYIGARSSTPAAYGPAGTLWLDMVKFTGEPYNPATSPATITVTRNGSGGIDISWDAVVSGILESAGSLTSPNWQPVAGSPATVNGKKVITISNPTGIQFFRLHQ